MNYDLSICIPQYNRLECLRDLLDSIIDQKDCPTPVEICISDDASTDDTFSLVRSYQKKHPHIQYYRFSQNVGLDTNMLKAVSLANGDYCWLMGNDDKIEQGSVEKIMSVLKKYEGIPLLNVNGWQYDNQLQNRLYHRVKRGLKKNILKNDELFCNLDEILFLFGDSFGFFGDNIVRRTLWNDVVENKDLGKYIGTCYNQLAVILEILQQDSRLLYVHRQCMGFRGGNDGFLDILGQFRRLKLDVEGYDRVAEGLFSKKSRLYKTWMSRIIKVHIRSRVLSIKLSESENSMHEVARLTYKHFSSIPAFWFHILPLVIVPRQILLAFRPIYRLTLKKLQH